MSVVRKIAWPDGGGASCDGRAYPEALDPGGKCRSLEAARAKLGGRVEVGSDRVPGTLVFARLRDGQLHVGVLLWSADGLCDVWFDDGLARRARSEAVFPRSGPVPESLLRIACEVRVFGALTEGARVRWERDTGLEEGRVMEKCRYGAIVVARGGKVIAVGFRKLWPTSIRATA